MIPTYSADGRRLRPYSREAIERLVALERVVVTKKRGKIVAATFRAPDGANPVQNTAHMGQYYSLKELLPSGNHAWKHKDLPESKAGELFVRHIFRAVQLSVLQ